MTTAPVAYEERLYVPLRWWALLTMFAASVLLAFLVATPVWVAAVVTTLVAGGFGALFLGYGAARISVRDGVLQAGRARIPLAQLGAAVALDAGASRQLAGVDADARAYLLLRPYVKQAVQVPVHDPGDPTPYWMLSTRRPDQLVAALGRPEPTHGVAD